MVFIFSIAGVFFVYLVAVFLTLIVQEVRRLGFTTPELIGYGVAFAFTYWLEPFGTCLALVVVFSAVSLVVIITHLIDFFALPPPPPLCK